MRPHASIGLQGAKTVPSNRSAFTRAELLATLGAIFLGAVILLPSFANTGTRSEQLGCLNNLRQIGIAFQAWGNEHDDQRPWFVLSEVTGNQGGTGGHPLMNNAWFQFTALSNHISPALLMDPGEIGHNKRVARTWSSAPGDSFLNANFRDNALSYMLGPHATIADAANILAADRNVFNNGLGGCSYGFTVFRVDRTTPSSFRGWTNGNHGSFGNVLLNDGRVEYTSSQRLHNILFGVNEGQASGHFLAPFD